MTEQQPYNVLKNYDGFELRSYPRHVLVQVTVRGSFISAGSIGFGPLIRYISGGNQTGQKIAMTAPVVQSSHDPETHVVSFVLPAGMQLSEERWRHGVEGGGPVQADAGYAALLAHAQGGEGGERRGGGLARCSRRRAPTADAPRLHLWLPRG
jgi:hypothetical protein